MVVQDPHSTLTQECPEQTCLTADLSPYISMFEMHSCNANYLLDSDM